VSRVATIDQVRAHWDAHIHDLEITQHPAGPRGFFDDIDQYHFEKLHHLVRFVDFEISGNGARALAPNPESRAALSRLCVPSKAQSFRSWRGVRDTSGGDAAGAGLRRFRARAPRRRGGR
jgi:hypothetical protein